jgi:hypothetical protein
MDLEASVLIDMPEQAGAKTPVRVGKWIWAIVALGALIAIALPIPVLLYLRQQEQAAEITAEQSQAEIEGEFQKIQALPEAVQTSHGSIAKLDGGLVSSTYKAQPAYPEIKAYYDTELARLGWRPLAESNLKYDGRDNGGKYVTYCKDRFGASFQYAGGQEEDFGWTYEVALIWGRTNPCK